MVWRCGINDCLWFIFSLFLIEISNRPPQLVVIESESVVKSSLWSSITLFVVLVTVGGLVAVGFSCGDVVLSFVFCFDYKFLVPALLLIAKC